MPVTLGDLGPRICILGPSNSGKSTLADMIARSRGHAPIHLDQLYHLPNTDWRPRPVEEFVTLHDAEIADERWVMDGNYSRCMQQRFARSTGVILLDVSTVTSLVRYLRRSWGKRDRIGGLDGGADSVKWDMIRHIVGAGRENRRRYRSMLAGVSTPTIELTSLRQITRFCQQQGLSRGT